MVAVVVVCGHCGGPMRRVAASETFRCYRCSRSVVVRPVKPEQH